MKTLQELATLLGGKYWEKGDIKRIYLDRGYNTKKMSTKTYVYERENGTFGVSVYIDCPSQAYQWIESQQNEIITSVEEEIEKALSETVYVLTDSEGKALDWQGNECSVYDASFFYTEKAAKKEIDNCYKYTSFITMPRAEFDAEYERLLAIEQAERAQRLSEAKQEQNVETIVPEKVLNAKFTIGGQVEHPKFGLGTVLSEEKESVKIDFNGDIKSLLKQFAPLSIVTNG